MQLPVGIGRAVMQDKQLCIGTRLTQLTIDVNLLPPGKDFRFLFRQTAAHRKIGAGQEDGIFVIHHTLS